MRVENVIVHNDSTWDEYLRLPGTSFSGLKEHEITPTFGMKIGSLTHTYLLKPREYSYEEADLVIPIARELNKMVPRAIFLNSVHETPLTAHFYYDGFRFRWKGVPDIRVPGQLIIDFKILAGPLAGYLQNFLYEEQLRGYMLPEGIPHGLIIAYNRKHKRVESHWVTPSPNWWQEITLTRGDVCKTLK